jgi:outer membrane protein OmpA-like peptidoglycan-associated protein
MDRAPQIAREMNLPNVDIEVVFAYDSNKITQETAASLLALGRALQDPRLANARFVIAGHTDARGTRAYNEALSERRAQAVRQFLIEHFKIVPDKLVARGFGESQLKNPRNPRAPENRRVQVINWTGQTAVQNGR